MTEKRKRAPTKTSTFGAGKRESHDAGLYYARALATPKISDDETIRSAPETDKIWCHTAEDMKELPDNSVALAITSPPYHVGHLYDTDQSFTDYLGMLERVFTETHRVLEPGGRSVVNVAGLGRKPYVPLPDLVTEQMRVIGFHNRGPVIWQKGEGMSGNCAWGSFMSPANPVLRDLHEFLVIGCKGRFDRAVKPKDRAERGLPHKPTISKADFMSWTLSIWKFAPESARRVGHPAPFPVELPRRCIELFTYEDDLVLDPFMGAGSTAVAAVRTNRHFVGYDTNADYITKAEERIAEERRQ